MNNRAHVVKVAAYRYAPKEPLTQKVRGIAALRGLCHNWLPVKAAPFTRYTATPGPWQVPIRCQGSLLEPKERFFRPCPSRPRHGFVDSRVLESKAEMYQLWYEARRHDPCAELVAMWFYAAEASLVLSPHAVTVGAGHDGATAGRQGSLCLPLEEVRFPSEALQQAGITGEPLLEAVWEGGEVPVYLVQLRDGVVNEGRVKGGRIVPEEATVSGYLYARGDLLAWEQQVEAAPPGTVVMHIGGSPLSHYSQHALLHGLPVVYADTACPQLGEQLSPTVASTTPRVADFQRGLLTGQRMELGSAYPARQMAFTLLAAHNATSWLTDSNGAYLLGAATMFALRYALALIVGELRFTQRRKQSRSALHRQVLDVNMFWNRRNYLSWAAGRFSTRHGWPGPAYGGKTWAACAVGARMLYKQIARFMRSGAAKDAKRIIRLLHRLINLQHNNGKLFDKLTPMVYFDQAAYGGVAFTAMASFAAYEVWQALPEPSLDDLHRWQRERLREHPKGSTVLYRRMQRQMQAAHNRAYMENGYCNYGPNNCCICAKWALQDDRVASVNIRVLFDGAYKCNVTSVRLRTGERFVGHWAVDGRMLGIQKTLLAQQAFASRVQHEKGVMLHWRQLPSRMRQDVAEGLLRHAFDREI